MNKFIVVFSCESTPSVNILFQGESVKYFLENLERIGQSVSRIIPMVGITWFTNVMTHFTLKQG